MFLFFPPLRTCDVLRKRLWPRILSTESRPDLARGKRWRHTVCNRKKCLKKKRGKSEWKHAWMSWKANRGKTERFLLFGAVQRSAVELISKFSGHPLGDVWWPLRFWSVMQAIQIFSLMARANRTEIPPKHTSLKRAIKTKVQFVWFSTLVSQTGSLIPAHHIMISW